MSKTDKETDIDRIGRAMSRYRVLAKSRAIARMTLGKTRQDMDVGYIDIVDLIGRHARRDQEVTIGTVAEHMRIDPSRASRAVAHLVDQGLVSRGVSQMDARRTVIFLTDEGKAFLREKKQVKLDLIEKLLADWPQDDVAQFAELYSRFVEHFENVVAELGEDAAAQTQPKKC